MSKGYRKGDVYYATKKAYCCVLDSVEEDRKKTKYWSTVWLKLVYSKNTNLNNPKREDSLSYLDYRMKYGAPKEFLWLP